MIIRSLELSHYRNYKEEVFYFEPGTNVFYGDNAQGKTNALEAIFLTACGKSHRHTKDKDIIGFEEEEAHIKVIAERCGDDYRIDVHLKKNGRKGIAINGNPIKKIDDLLGMVRVVIFAPEDLSIIKSAPAERRNFLNISLCQLDKIYTYNLINYNKVLAQKNKLLKQIDDDTSLRDTLSIWNEQLLGFGKKIIERRSIFINELSNELKEIHSQITGGTEELEIEYEPCCQVEDFERYITRNSEREIAARMSLFGPHRDDIIFKINGIDVRSFGSQGQQRTVALSLKLAEIEMVKKISGDMPVLLLDDVLSELDEGRQKRLLQSIDGIQTIITCTGLDEFIDNRFKIDKTFFIDTGKVKDAK